MITNNTERKIDFEKFVKENACQGCAVMLGAYNDEEAKEWCDKCEKIKDAEKICPQ